MTMEPVLVLGVRYDPGLERQTPAFDAAQGRLKEALDGLFAEAEQELAGLPDQAREGKALRSLVNHREGLCVFVDRPQVPLDNNLAERVLRGPAIGRRLSFGSDSEIGDRRPVHGRDVLGRRHARLERHRRPALDGSVAGSMREERRACAGRPVAVAAMVDERGAQARLHGGSMTGRVECRYYGRDFTAGEMALLRALIAVDPQPTRGGLSREFCRLIGWFKPDGGLKDMMARVTMLAMHRDGLGECQKICARAVLSDIDEPFAEEDGELCFGLEPFPRRTFPRLGRMIENEI